MPCIPHHKQLKVIERDGSFCQECYRPVLFHFAVDERERPWLWFTNRVVFLRDSTGHRRYILRRGTMDHIVPRSQGGGHRVSNLRVLCAACNNARATKPVNHYLEGILVPRQPLSTRYSSEILTLLQRAGMRVDAYSVLGDTLTVDAVATGVQAVLVANGAEQLIWEVLPNRIYGVFRLGTQHVTIRQKIGEILTDVVHWTTGTKLEKIGNRLTTDLPGVI